MNARAKHYDLLCSTVKTALLFAIFLHCAIAGVTQINLSDAAPSTLGLQAFKLQLQRACEQRSVALLRPLLADTIYDGPDDCGYPGCKPDKFLKYNFHENDDWEQLANILRFGFRKVSTVGDEFGGDSATQCVQGPTYEGQYDYDQQLFVVKRHVAIKGQPDVHAKTIEKVSLTLLQKGGEFVTDCEGCIPHRDHYEYEFDGKLWLKVLGTRGEMGYIPIDATSDKFFKTIRLCKIQGDWKIYYWFHNRPT